MSKKTRICPNILATPTANDNERIRRTLGLLVRSDRRIPDFLRQIDKFGRLAYLHGRSHHVSGLDTGKWPIDQGVGVYLINEAGFFVQNSERSFRGVRVLSGGGIYCQGHCRA